MKRADRVVSRLLQRLSNVVVGGTILIVAGIALIIYSKRED